MPRAQSYAHLAPALGQWLERCHIDRCDEAARTQLLEASSKIAGGLLADSRGLTPSLGALARPQDDEESFWSAQPWAIYEANVYGGAGLGAARERRRMRAASEAASPRKKWKSHREAEQNRLAHKRQLRGVGRGTAVIDVFVWQMHDALLNFAVPEVQGVRIDGRQPKKPLFDVVAWELYQQASSASATAACGEIVFQQLKKLASRLAEGLARQAVGATKDAARARTILLALAAVVGHARSRSDKELIRITGARKANVIHSRLNAFLKKEVRAALEEFQHLGSARRDELRDAGAVLLSCLADEATSWALGHGYGSFLDYCRSKRPRTVRSEKIRRVLRDAGGNSESGSLEI